MDVFNFNATTVSGQNVLLLTVPSDKKYYIKGMNISGQTSGGAIKVKFSTGLELNLTVSPLNCIAIDDERCLPSGGSITITSAHDGIFVEANGLVI